MRYRLKSASVWHGWIMPTPEIIQRARDLQRDVGTADPELAADLVRVLASPDDRARYGSLRERLRTAVARFEADHPKLAGAAQGLIDELVAAGL
jgi:hypothetical protein